MRKILKINHNQKKRTKKKKIVKILNNKTIIKMKTQNKMKVQIRAFKINRIPFPIQAVLGAPLNSNSNK